MALNTVKCNHLTPLGLKGLTSSSTPYMVISEPIFPNNHFAGTISNYNQLKLPIYCTHAEIDITRLQPRNGSGPGAAWSCQIKFKSNSRDLIQMIID